MGFASCASGAFLLARFFGGAFAGALVVVFCDASSRPPRLRFLACCLGAPGCLDLGAAAFLSGRGTCVFANCPRKSAFLGFLGPSVRFGCAFFGTCRGFLLAAPMGEYLPVVNRAPWRVATIGTRAGSRISLGLASMRNRPSGSSTALGFWGLPVILRDERRRFRSIWSFSSVGLCSSSRLFSLLFTSAVLFLLAFLFRATRSSVCCSWS